MAIVKKTTIDQMEITGDGHIQVRFGLLVLEDGVEISKTWHRSIVPPGVDPAVMLAAVNADITTRETLRAQPVDPARVPLLAAICALVHTPEVIAKYQEAVARADAEEMNRRRAGRMPS